MEDNANVGPFGAPEPPEEWFIERGWILRDGVRWKPGGNEPVFFVDIINAYPPLKAWVEERTKCCRDGSCSSKSDKSAP